MHLVLIGNDNPKKVMSQQYGYIEDTTEQALSVTDVQYQWVITYNVMA